MKPYKILTQSVILLELFLQYIPKIFLKWKQNRIISKEIIKSKPLECEGT